MAPILRFAAERSLPVIEDAACALGATYHGVHAGSLGDVACFSFHPRKIITTGEGGLITTQDPALASKLRLLCSHGGSPRELYLEFIAAGYNYRLSDINAAVGIVQMKKLEDLLLKRRTIAIRYLEILGDVAGISLPSEPVGLRHTFQSFVILLDSGLDRDSVIRHMRSKGVEVTLGTYSLSCQPAYGGKASTRRTSLSRSQRAFHSSLTLPLFPQMTMDQVDEVCEVLRQSLAMAAE
jgi:dTDP-4-amino-4,6-dideoxygalactose transaminase